MDNATLLWVIVLSGGGTLLIRYLPMRWQERGIKSARGSQKLRKALDAIGPSAIVALLMASLANMLAPAVIAQNGLPIVMGLIGVVAGKRLVGDIAWSTLSGVIAYGVTVWLLTIV
ncbi:hypothetical protein EKL30_02665 [Candidimonas sp. SYP-B2681]|uniref:AzlD domain-containing protein n=1 Tax=Candidimonas sp. SYP-B2681 TaxID=2497686 RepID=UPI000F8726B8|nr:AzlD domain-containing protein [Candidimonas sp. SYP-B2681]RTZ47900.1 hypothetical protein EKL30_02665 [Candidimonas sp. SYP-B2681]